MQLMPGEQIIAKSMANLFRGIEAVGGNLYLTTMRIHYESHAFNIQTGPLDIPYNAVADVKPRNTMGLVPNGFSVFTRDGQEFKFVVWGRDKLIGIIKQGAGIR